MREGKMKNLTTRKITTGMMFVIMVLSIFFSTGAFAANVELSDGTAVDSQLQTDAVQVATEIGVAYRGHVENIGDMPAGEDNFIASPDPIGTRGDSLRVEGFMMKLTGAVPEGAKIVYEVHVQNEGWMKPVSNGDFAGTRAKSQRVESIKIHLENMPGYDVYYQGHVQNVGDIPQIAGDWGWVKNGEELGTTGSSLRLEELTVKIVKREDVTFNNAGTFGPKTGVEVVDDNVTINKSDVILQNMHITGNLTIGEGVGEGDVTLNNVIVDGNTYVKGGGNNSIHINGGQYNNIIVQQTSSGQVRIVAVDTDGLEVVISEDAEGEDIILEGAFDNVTIEAPNVKISTQGDTQIGEFNVLAGATGSQVTLDAKTTVDKLILDEKAEMKGQGTVKEADVNKDGVTFEKAPDKQVVEPGVTPPVVTPPVVPPVVPPTPGGGGGTSDTTAPNLSGVTAGPVVIGANIAATSNEAGYLYLVPATTAVNKTAIEAAGTASNGQKVAATANVSANLITTNFAAGNYKVYAIDASGNVSSGSSAISVTAVIEWATTPVTTIAKTGDNPPYQLMQINYKRNADVTSSVMTIKMKTPASGDVAADTVLWKSSGGTTQNASAYWQWSYRDARSVFVSGSLDNTSQTDLNSIERANEKQLKTGSVVTVEIIAVKDSVPTTISREYTITADDVTNSTYFAASEAATALTTIQGYATSHGAGSLTTALLAQAGVTEIKNGNLLSYKDAIAGSSSMADLAALQLLIDGVNTKIADDKEKPVVTSGTVSRTSATQATVSFTSNENGYFFLAVGDASNNTDGFEPSGEGVPIYANKVHEIGIGDLKSISAKDAFIEIKDEAGNLSQVVKMVIPAYVAPDTILESDNTTLELNNGVLATNFTWKSVNGIGSQNPSGPSTTGYTYYTDGAYCRFQVKNPQGQVVRFADIFQTGAAQNDTVGGMTLQTGSGSINDMDGSGRERADWGADGADASLKTNLTNTGNCLFYGLVQGAAYNGTKTVGFSAGETRTVAMTLTPKTDLHEGTYSLTVETLQQGSDSVKDSINYTFVIPDTTPPVVEKAVEHDVATKTITYTFSEPVQLINQSTNVVANLTKDLLGIYEINAQGDYTNNKVGTIDNVTLDSTGKILTIKYSGSLAKLTEVSYVVDAWGYSITDLKGNRIAKGDSKQVFTVAADTKAPEISKITAKSTTGNIESKEATASTIGVDSGFVVNTIDITMNEDVKVDLNTLVTMKFPKDGMPGYPSALYGTVTGVSGNVITITPYENSKTATFGGTFTFELPSDSVKDLAGNAFTGNATLIVNSLVAEISSAKDYSYSGFSYTGQYSYNQDTNTIASSYTGEQYLAGAAMNDMARYLGALNRQDNSTITTIIYDNKTYTWIPTPELAGSNWRDGNNSNKTLVSDIVDYFKANSSADGFSVRVSDGVNEQDVNFKFVVKTN